MRPALCLALALSACAAGRVSPDGTVTAWALGSARIERCVEIVGQPRSCVVVAGGPLSEGLLGTIGAAFRAVLPAGAAR